LVKNTTQNQNGGLNADIIPLKRQQTLLRAQRREQNHQNYQWKWTPSAVEKSLLSLCSDKHFSTESYKHI